MILSNLYGYRFAIDIDLRNRVLNNWKQKIEKDMIELNLPEEEKKLINLDIAQFLILDAVPTQYYISKAVLEFAKQIKIKPQNSYKWLFSISDQTSQYNFGNAFIRFTKKDKKIVAFSSSIAPLVEEYDYIHYDFLNIDLENGKANVPLNETGVTAYLLLLQLLSFIELSEIEEITVGVKKQHGYGSKKDPSNIFNDNPFPIIIVNSRWAQRVYRPGEIHVRAHDRLQPKGPGRSQYELIFIEPYTKKGMTIRAGKEKNN